MPIRRLPFQALASLLLSVGLMGLPAHAQVAKTVELSNGNSKVLVDLGSLGVYDWTVDGVNQVFRANTYPGPLGELYFLNLGQEPNRPEVGLNTFTLNTFEQRATNALTASFTGFGGILDFQYDMELQGGQIGSGFSSRYETVTLINRSNTSQEISLFSYLDFEIAQTYRDDTLLIEGGSLTQSDPTGTKAIVTVDQLPDNFEAGTYPILFTKLALDGGRTTLNGQNSVVNGDGSAILQFNRVLAPGESAVFRFLKQIEKTSTQDVPEPGIVIALSSTAVAGLLLKKFKKAD
ncbi:MAG TPA: hypothetical protein V6D29_20560 [Leptolyngbyaceae cyanobacterium]